MKDDGKEDDRTLSELEAELEAKTQKLEHYIVLAQERLNRLKIIATLRQFSDVSEIQFVTDPAPEINMYLRNLKTLHRRITRNKVAENYVSRSKLVGKIILA
ncbi:MAG: hypothetical protein JST85_18060 [Acidobacteria bacterium]|nr:hypothetical protein [Acidobacteriota bacterium]